MPYIKKEQRAKFDKALDQITDIPTKGELEYCLYALMMKFMTGKEYRYSVLHDCTYAAIHCGDEFRRRNLDHREHAAILENGDIGLNLDREQPTGEKPHPMLCVSHGGSGACEMVNILHGFTCPKCLEEENEFGKSR